MRLSLFFFNYLHSLRVVTSLRLDIDESQERTLLSVAIKYKCPTYYGALNFTCIYNKAWILLWCCCDLHVRICSISIKLVFKRRYRDLLHTSDLPWQIDVTCIVLRSWLAMTIADPFWNVGRLGCVGQLNSDFLTINRLQKHTEWVAALWLL